MQFRILLPVPLSSPTKILVGNFNVRDFFPPCQQAIVCHQLGVLQSYSVLMESTWTGCQLPVRSPRLRAPSQETVSHFRCQSIVGHQDFTGSNARGLDSIPGQGVKSHVPHLSLHPATKDHMRSSEDLACCNSLGAAK